MAISLGIASYSSSPVCVSVPAVFPCGENLRVSQLQRRRAVNGFYLPASAGVGGKASAGKICWDSFSVVKKKLR